VRWFICGWSIHPDFFEIEQKTKQKIKSADFAVFRSKNAGKRDEEFPEKT